jgi:hypothetical protein
LDQVAPVRFGGGVELHQLGVQGVEPITATQPGGESKGVSSGDLVAQQLTGQIRGPAAATGGQLLTAAGIVGGHLLAAFQ